MEYKILLTGEISIVNNYDTQEQEKKNDMRDSAKINMEEEKRR